MHTLTPSTLLQTLPGEAYEEPQFGTIRAWRNGHHPFEKAEVSRERVVVLWGAMHKDDATHVGLADVQGNPKTWVLPHDPEGWDGIVMFDMDMEPVAYQSYTSYIDPEDTVTVDFGLMVVPGLFRTEFKIEAVHPPEKKSWWKRLFGGQRS